MKQNLDANANALAAHNERNRELAKARRSNGWKRPKKAKAAQAPATTPTEAA